jgi:hypothetical protein
MIQKGGVDVRLHRPVELLGGDVEDRRMGLLAARVVDDDVEAAQAAHRLFYELLAECLVAQVAGNGKGDAFLRLD